MNCTMPARRMTQFMGSIIRTPMVSVCQSDPAPGLPDPRMSDTGAVGGRGLAIVDELAARWGCDVDELGTTVWFELPAPQPRPGR